MAIVQAGAGALRMDEILNTRGNVSYGPNNIRVTSSSDTSDYTDFAGSYNYSTGFPVGTVTGIVDTVNGQTHYTVTNANSDATTLFSYIQNQQYLAAEAYVLRGNDTVLGKGADDYLIGFDGDDTIKAGAGIDTLVGGVGRDKLTGGTGNDTFVFQDTADSTAAKSGRDTIQDFHHSEHDKIDLSAIDAKSGSERNDKFALVDAFDGHAGQLVVTAIHGGFLVQGDTDGVNGADFSITVKTDDLALVKGDFAF